MARSRDAIQRDINRERDTENREEQRRREFERRRNDIDRLRSTFASNVNSNVGTVNSSMNSASSSLRSGVSMTGQDSRIDAMFTGRNEQNIGGDRDLGDADRAMINERNRAENDRAAAEQARNNARIRRQDLERELRNASK